MTGRVEVVIVQHGEKDVGSGDVGLSRVGREQAEMTARYLSTKEWDDLFCSPLRRARETATAIGDACGLRIRIDDRLRERMNWGGVDNVQTLEAFLADWNRSTQDRSWRPPSGESSHVTGARFREAIESYVANDDRRAILVVSHGGATVDLLRTLFGDTRVRVLAPTVLDDGIPNCALTRLTFEQGSWRIERIGDTHLDRC